MNRRRLSLICCLITGLAWAQLARAFSNEFLNIGVDARAFGMANSVVAHTSDVNSAYWNPAGLTQVTEGIQIAAMHAAYFQNIANYDYAAVALPLENDQTLAVSLFRFGVDDILNTTQLIDSQGNIDFDRVSTFSTADYALGVSYAGNFLRNKNLALGANAKLVYRHIGPFAQSFGFGLDLGLQYRSEQGFYFGVMARDVTTTFNAWSINEDELNTQTVTEPGTGTQVTVNELPEETIELTLPKFQVGVAQDIPFGDNFLLKGELDLHMRLAQTNDLISTENLSITPSAGVELAFKDLVFLRAGVGNFQQETDFDGNNFSFQPNFGVGFKYRGINVDYALTDIGDQSIALYSNIFSVKIDLAEF